MEDMDYKFGAGTGGYFPLGGYSEKDSKLIIGGDDSWLSGDVSG